MYGVKFYSVSDGSSGYQLEQLKKIVDDFDPARIDYNINEVMELYNISLYIKANMYLPSWDEAEITKIKETMPLLAKNIAIFMKSITNTNLSSTYNELDIEYVGDFWAAFCNFKLYQLISPEVVKLILSKNQYHLRYFLYDGL